MYIFLLVFRYLNT